MYNLRVFTGIVTPRFWVPKSSAAATQGQPLIWALRPEVGTAFPPVTHQARQLPSRVIHEAPGTGSNKQVPGHAWGMLVHNTYRTQFYTYYAYLLYKHIYILLLSSSNDSKAIEHYNILNTNMYTSYSKIKEYLCHSRHHHNLKICVSDTKHLTITGAAIWVRHDGHVQLVRVRC